MHDGQGPEQVGQGAVGRWGSGVRWEVGKKGSKRTGGRRWGRGTAEEEEVGGAEEGGRRSGNRTTRGEKVGR